MAEKKTKHPKSRCENCRKLWRQRELQEIRDLTQRVSPGETMPSGQCPDCGALCHLVKESTGVGKPTSIVEKYLASACNVCPFCGSRVLVCGSIEADGRIGWSEVECQTCGHSWQDVWQCGDMTEVADKDGKPVPMPESVEERAAAPTVVIFVEGGAVQGVEGDGPARIVICDFDVEEAAREVGGRPCITSVWDSPSEPSKEFREAAYLTRK